MLPRHAAAHVMGWRGGWAVGCADTRVVLRSAPREPNARVSNWVPLHLVDSHLSSVAMDELDEAAALSRRDLHVSDLAKSLKEGPEFIFRDITGEATNKNSRVVWVRELVHRLHGIEPMLIVIRLLLWLDSPAHLSSSGWIAHGGHHGSTGLGTTVATVLVGSTGC